LKSCNIDVKKMPLGKISKAELQRGMEVLEKIEKVLKSGKTTGLTELTNEFYTRIPHDFGRQRPPVINGMDEF
jgi:poly [ADP-ribose] polymerase